MSSANFVSTDFMFLSITSNAKQNETKYQFLRDSTGIDPLSDNCCFDCWLVSFNLVNAYHVNFASFYFLTQNIMRKQDKCLTDNYFLSISL